jgi:ADP-heptose:LPS heptosyltransferase
MNAPTPTPRRILFALRGKLGDSLACFATVQAWRDAHPADRLTLLTRRDYANLLRGDSDIEAGVEVVGFNSRLGMILRLLAWRLLRPPFDALAVLWGFGKPIRWIGKLARAPRKAYLDGRFAPLFDAWPPAATFDDFVSRAEPAWRVARCLEADLPLPDKITLPHLAARRPANLPADAPLALVPLADERRRCLDAADVARLAGWLTRTQPGRPLWLLANPHDQGAAELLAAPPAGVIARPFASLDELLALYAGLAGWYGTDTGLYHLAAAMGVPATVIFGPSEPAKVLLPGQPRVAGLRLAGLGPLHHCDVTSCQQPRCLQLAVALAANEQAALQPLLDLAPTPAACPLRTLPAATLSHPNALLTYIPHSAP